MRAQEKFYKAKRRRKELEHAKETADVMWHLLYRQPLDPMVPFPGLQEARRRESKALDEWMVENRGKDG